MNRMIRIFISSTFQNFQEERNRLAQEVFPQLDELCRRNAFSFQIIDLRWGVSRQDAFDNESVQICFDEIARCQQLSPRPNFLVMVGSRYGWRPLPTRISAKEWELLQIGLEEEQRGALAAWYFQDLNSLDRPYILRPRRGKYLDSGIWTQTEAALSEILFSQAEKYIQDENALRRYGLSATEQEIWRGLLDAKDAKSHTFVMLKEEEESDEPPAIRAKGEALKARLRAQMEDVKEKQLCIYAPGEDDYIQRARAFLTEVIQKQIRQATAESRLEQERQILEEELEGVRQMWLERPALYGNFGEFLKRMRGRAGVVMGPSGCGKSMFLKYWTALHRKQTAAFFSEIQPYSHSLSHALFLCMHQLRDAGLLAEVEQEPEDAACLGWLERHLERTDPARDILILLDCVENITGWDRLADSILRIRIPEHVTVLLGCVSGDSLREQDRAARLQAFVMPLADSGEALALVNAGLKRCGRCLTEAQARWLREKLPAETGLLYLTLLTDRCARLTSESDFRNVLPVPADTEAMIRRLLDAAGENGYRTLRTHALAYFALATDGLAERELIRLLALDPEVLEEIRGQTEWEFDEHLGIPPVLWARLYYEVRQLFAEVNQNGVVLLRYRHQMLADVIARAVGEPVMLQLAGYMAAFFEAEEWYLCSESGAISANLRKTGELYPLYVRLQDRDRIRSLFGDPFYLDCCIRCGKYRETVRSLAEFLRDKPGDRLFCTLQLLLDKNILLQTWNDSYLQAAVAAGLAQPEVLRRVHKHCWLEFERKADSLQGMRLPDAQRCALALRRDHLLALLQGGMIRLYQYDLKMDTGAFCVLGSDDFTLYWSGQELVAQGEYLRVTLRYNGRELYETGRSPCRNWDNLFQLQQNPVGNEEAEARPVSTVTSPVFKYWSSSGIAEARLNYPADTSLLICCHGALAAVLVDNCRIDVIDLEKRLLLSQYDTPLTGRILWGQSGEEVLAVCEDGLVLVFSVKGAAQAVPLPEERISGRGRAMAGIYRGIREVTETFALAGSLCFGGRVPLATTGFYSGAGRQPLLWAFSAKANWIACYYRYYEESILRLFRISDGRCIASGLVDPVFPGDLEDGALYAGSDGRELMLTASGRTRTLDIETLKWRRAGISASVSAQQNDRSESDISGLSKANVRAREKILAAYAQTMRSWLPLSKQRRQIAAKHRRLLDYLQDGVVEGIAGFCKTVFHLQAKVAVQESELLYRRLSRLPLSEQPFAGGRMKILWLTDTVNGIISVYDGQGNCLCREQPGMPIAASEADGENIQILAGVTPSLQSGRLRYDI